MGTDYFVKLPLNEPTCRSLEQRLSADDEFKATVKGVDALCFGIQSTDSDTKTFFHLDGGRASISQGTSSTNEAQFMLTAQSSHWAQFFSAVPKRPFQSYWGMIRVIGKKFGVEVIGDQQAFTKHARLWRIILDRLRDVLSEPSEEGEEESYEGDDEVDDDSLIGHYTWLTLPIVGKSKIFYEVSGTGPQALLFLHTAGADSRQYHSMMLNKALQARCKMYAFDLPGHGRSFPGTKQYPLSYSNSEDFYINCIRQFLIKLKLKRVIVSGASMGGQICLSVALRAEELGVRGVIPCEACDYIPSAAGTTIYSLQGDESILNAERVCGMISPTSPEIYKRLNWWIYSSQASQMFPGDLKFYFDGWDGRERMRLIDSEVCPVYMLTGEYDYSCMPDMSRVTVERIKAGGKAQNVVFEEMKGLGHFPFSEDPERFMPYLVKALDFILERSKG